MSINPHFKTFLGLSEAERRIAYESAADMLNTSDKYIEKDLWTCHVLDALFNTVTTERTRLLFKGGTSLSKGYNVIQRFSEDIDITVFREDMGFAGDNDPANPAMSNNQRRKLVQALVGKTAEYIQGDLRNTLLAELHDCHLRVDPKDDEGMTLLVEYDSLYENAPKEYIQPHIKIEGGARSALEPHSLQAVSPYIQSQLEDIDLSVTGITTIDAERTFLDKLLILHGWHCGYRDQDRLPSEGQRLSRHYYDVATMATTTFANRAINDMALFKNVIDHAQMLYRRSWMKLDEIKTEGIKLIPQDELHKNLETDYNLMKGMLFGEKPSFSSLVERIKVLENNFNEHILGETNSMEVPAEIRGDSAVTPSP